MALQLRTTVDTYAYRIQKQEPPWNLGKGEIRRCESLYQRFPEQLYQGQYFRYQFRTSLTLFVYSQL